MSELEPTPEPIPEPTPEPTPEPVVAAPEPMPAWDWPTPAPIVAAPAVEPEPTYIYDPVEVQRGAVSQSVDSVKGLLTNQAALRSQMAAQGANPETVQLAEYALLSMDPKMMGDPQAAQVAASLAIGTMTMQGKSWKQAPIPTPPPSNPIGKENPSYTAPETEQATKEFNAAFAKLGIDASLLEEPD